MSHDRNNPDGRDGADDSAHEHLPLFGDGRLPLGPDDDIEAWLSAHPEAAEGLADVQRLKELYQTAAPPDPEAAAWTAALTRIAHAVPVERPRRAGAARHPWWAVVGLTAAAALVAVVLTRSWWLGGPTPQSQPEEPYPVAEADDITIISMDARDIPALIVGEPPVSGELVFARPTDIRVIKCERCPKSGNMPRLAQGEVPMFVTSVARAPNPDDE